MITPGRSQTPATALRGQEGKSRLLLMANTSKERTMSLYNQGLYWCSASPALREARLVLLMTAYANVIKEHAIFC